MSEPPTPLNYSSISREPVSRRELVGTAVLWAIVFPITLMAGWLAFWNIGFEPIIGVLAAVLFAVGITCFVRAVRNPRRRFAVIAGGVMGTVLAMVVIGLAIVL